MKRLSDDRTLRGLLGPVRSECPSELARRACARTDRRSAGGRRGGRGLGGSAVFGDPKAYLVTNFSALNHLKTSAGGGEPGVNTGFGFLWFGRVEAINNNDALFWRQDGTTGETGYEAHMITTGLVARAGLGVGSGIAQTPVASLIASDLGKLTAVIGTVQGGVLRLWYGKRPLQQTAAAATYGPFPTGTTDIGTWTLNSAFAGEGASFGAFLTWRGTPTDQQLEALLDYVRTHGDVPESFAGATVTHRNSVKSALRGQSSPVGRTSYGARGFTTANYLGTAPGAGIQGSDSGLWYAYYGRPDIVPVGSQSISHCFGTTSGWYLQFANATVRGGIANAAGQSIVTPSYTIPSADYGRPALYLLHWDGAALSLWINRTLVGSTARVNTPQLVASGAAMTVGQYSGTQGLAAASWFGSAGGNVALTQAEILQLVADVERTGAIQAVPGKTSGIWLLDAASAAAVPASIPNLADAAAPLVRTGTLEVARYVEAAPPLPATLPDTTTNASVDAFARVGQPLVKVIDPGIDGRSAQGVLGFAALTWFESANATTGIRGTGTGFHVRAVFTPYTLTGSEYVASASNGSGTTGWTLYRSTSFFRVTVGNGTNGTISRTIASSELGVPHHVELIYDGVNVEMVWDGVSAGKIAATYLFGVSKMSLGTLVGSSFPATGLSIFGLAGGDGATTLADAVGAYNGWLATGRIQRTATTQHLYDVGLDIEANGGAIPATLLDRIGTDHLNRVGPAVHTLSGRLGVQQLNSTQAYYSTVVTGGFPGSSQMWLLARVTVFSQAVSSGIRSVASRANGSNAGWEFRFTGTNTTFNVVVANGAGARTALSAGSLAAGDIGVSLPVLYTLDGGTARIFVRTIDRVASMAIEGYTPFAGSMGLGWNCEGYAINGFSAGYGSLSDPEITALLASTANAPTVPGKTFLAHDFGQDVSDGGGKLLPARSVDRAGTSEPLYRVGAELQVASRVERVYAYDSAPVMTGLQTSADSAYYTTAGIPAASWTAQGGTLAALIRIDSQSGSVTRVIASTTTGQANNGLYLQTTGANNFLSCVAFNGVGTGVTSPTYSIVAADIGRLLLVAATLDVAGGRLRFYVKRLEQSTGSVIAGFTPSTGSLQLLRHALGSNAALNLTVFGFYMAPTTATLAEIQALHDACVANEDMLGIPGRPGMLISVKRSAGAAVSPPAQLTDQTGTDHMTLQGSPTLVPHYARAWGW